MKAHQTLLRPFLLLTSIVCILFSSSELAAQSSSKLLEQAKAYIAAAHYDDALNTLGRSRRLSTKEEEGRFLTAVCHYQLNDLEAATAILETLVAEEKSPYPECWLYLGRIRQAQQQFDLAVQHYKLYLRTLRPEHPNRPMVIENIRRCDNGLRWLYREPAAIVENLGDKVNTAHDEFAPVLSPNRSSYLYFSSIRPGNTGGPRNAQTKPDEQFGHHLSDMYTSQVAGGIWQEAQPMHYLLNTPQHEQVLAFNKKGQVLLYYRGWSWETGQIFADTFQQATQRSLTTTPFLGPIQETAGEFNLHLRGDTILTFAARRADGFGGLDLYQAYFRNGHWGPAINLGPEINSAFDETTPFLARDGQTLYYSTNDSRRSVGGLDIVRSVYLPDAQRWSSAENLGFPLNSAADDSHFRLARDGFTGFFCSARKDGYGLRDLYIAFFTKYRKEMESPVVQNAPPIIKPTRTPVISNTPKPNTPLAAPQSSTANWSVNTNTVAALNGDARVRQMLQDLGSTGSSDKIVLSIYVPLQANTPNTTKLFSALDELQELLPLIRQNGIGHERIFTRALIHNTSHYTLTVSLSPASNNVTTDLPVLGQTQSLYQASLPANRALSYRVQVSAVQRAPNDNQLNTETELMLEKAANSPYYRYTVGTATTYADAQKLQQRLLSAGRRGAYIVAYIHGRRLDKIEAKLYQSAFPELIPYSGR